eukprot:UN05716
MSQVLWLFHFFHLRIPHALLVYCWNLQSIVFDSTVPFNSVQCFLRSPCFVLSLLCRRQQI